MDATGALRILSANFLQRTGYADGRGTIGPAGEAKQTPDSGTDGAGGGDLRGSDDGSEVVVMIPSPTPPTPPVPGKGVGLSVGI